MKAPLSWLREYVDIDCTAEQLKDKLFSCFAPLKMLHRPVKDRAYYILQVLTRQLFYTYGRICIVNI